MTKVLFDISISNVELSLLKVMSDNICEPQSLRSTRRKSQQSWQTPRHSLPPPLWGQDRCAPGASMACFAVNFPVEINFRKALNVEVDA
jgi:hypothetical protein